MELTVIGGCGGYPDRGRPCSGYVVRLDGFSILIDPGYGVGTALTIDERVAFDAVLVTHGHPDHCVDLNAILRTRLWAAPPAAPLPVYALPGALEAVMALDRQEALAGSFVLRDIEPGVEFSIGPFQVRSALLPHPRPNIGIRLSNAGRSLVYSGDCGPSEGLIRLADGTDVLLAEASYAATVPLEIVGALSSAADVGHEAASARVQRLILTHLMPSTDETEAVTAAGHFYAGQIDVARPGLVVKL